jgi:GntR family transcriptional regulator, sialic acid-inducible nan operon repressor
MRRYTIERQKLSDRVAALLEEEIIRGVRPTGDQLPSEREMMRQFGVGRPAIREALSALQRKGLVLISSGTRARVTRPTPAAILGGLSGAARHLLEQPGGQQHFQEARAFFEIGLARYAARHATTKDLERLEAALDANRATIGDLREFKRTDVEFHFVLAEIPRNSIFVAIHDAMVDWLTDQREITLPVPGQVQIAYKAHERIFKAVASGDPDTAEKAMVSHLRQLYRVYEQVRAGVLPKTTTDRSLPFDISLPPAGARSNFRNRTHRRAGKV